MVSRQLPCFDCVSRCNRNFPKAAGVCRFHNLGGVNLNLVQWGFDGNVPVGSGTDEVFIGFVDKYGVGCFGKVAIIRLLPSIG